jgi:hypothetical protein
MTDWYSGEQLAELQAGVEELNEAYAELTAALLAEA